MGSPSPGSRILSPRAQQPSLFYHCFPIQFCFQIYPSHKRSGHIDEIAMVKFDGNRNAYIVITIGKSNCIYNKKGLQTNLLNQVSKYILCANYQDPIELLHVNMEILSHLWFAGILHHPTISPPVKSPPWGWRTKSLAGRSAAILSYLATYLPASILAAVYSSLSAAAS